MGKWFQFIKERFSPAAYIPMIVVFTALNGLYVAQVTSGEWLWDRFAWALLLMLSFFFRMRLFDEIKDYEVDLKINPTRPLARGLITIPQVKKALLFLIVLELAVAFYLGWDCFTFHALAIGYSLLMYEEFFIGDFLRPHLTTYAVTHTFSSFLLAISAALAVTGLEVTEFPLPAFAFLLMNWAFFNLFEFARKTFATGEERPHVPSYSNIFGRKGAWFLSISQVVIGVALVSTLNVNPLVIGAMVVYVILSAAYLVKDSAAAAKFFRNISGVYLLVHYLILIFLLRM